MTKRLTQGTISCALAVVFLVSAGSPGLLLHNCRQYGTQSTQLCDCCAGEAVAERGCCAKPEEAAPAHCSTESLTPASVETGCCFVSYERPLSFHGQTNGALKFEYSLSDAVPLPSVVTMTAIVTAAPAVDREGGGRHCSDPPLFLLTHSFRC